MPITLQALTPAGLPALQALQQAYFSRNPGRQPVDAHIYLSPYFAGGQNVLCAHDESGRLLAYAPYFPQNDLAWVDIQAQPALEDAAAVQDALFEGLLGLARRHGQACLNFQYAPFETASIDYAKSRGADCAYHIYNLQRDLNAPIAEAPLAPGFCLRRWRMESEPEQTEYLAARNECFPEAPTTLAEWQFFAGSPLWQSGINIAAFTADAQPPELAASVLVFWEPGSPAAATEYIFTRPAYRGRGLAGALITAALRYLKESGLQAAVLEVKAANTAALSVYTNLGYRLTGETEVWQVKI